MGKYCKINKAQFKLTTVQLAKYQKTKLTNITANGELQLHRYKYLHVLLTFWEKLINNLQVILRYVNSENTIWRSTKRTLHINAR